MKVLQYNTHLFLGTVVPDKYEDETRLTGIIDRVIASGADIVGLNEVWADDTKARIVDRTKRWYPYSFFQPNTSTFKLGSGLLLLSKHRIVNPVFTEYTHSAGWDASSQKGMISAKLLVYTNGAWSTFFVVITHTQSGESADDVAARGAGIDQLWSVIRSLPFGNNPLLIYGDLNVIGESGGRGTIEYSRLTTKMKSLSLNDLYRVAHTNALTHPGFTYDPATNRLIAKFAPDDHVAQRLDYFFGRNLPGPVTCDVITDFQYNDPESPGLMDLSDHYPMHLSA